MSERWRSTRSRRWRHSGLLLALSLYSRHHLSKVNISTDSSRARHTRRRNVDVLLYALLLTHPYARHAPGRWPAATHKAGRHRVWADWISRVGGDGIRDTTCRRPRSSTGCCGMRCPSLLPPTAEDRFPLLWAHLLQ